MGCVRPDLRRWERDRPEVHLGYGRFLPAPPLNVGPGVVMHPGIGMDKLLLGCMYSGLQRAGRKELLSASFQTVSLRDG